MRFILNLTHHSNLTEVITECKSIYSICKSNLKDSNSEMTKRTLLYHNVLILQCSGKKFLFQEETLDLWLLGSIPWRPSFNYSFGYCRIKLGKDVFLEEGMVSASGNLTYLGQKSFDVFPGCGFKTPMCCGSRSVYSNWQSVSF